MCIEMHYSCEDLFYVLDILKAIGFFFFFLEKLNQFVFEYAGTNPIASLHIWS